jgi:hypothetical protein
MINTSTENSHLLFYAGQKIVVAAGDPKPDGPRLGAVIVFRVTDADRQRIMLAADARGQTLSGYLRAALATNN